LVLDGLLDASIAVRLGITGDGGASLQNKRKGEAFEATCARLGREHTLLGALAEGVANAGDVVNFARGFRGERFEFILEGYGVGGVLLADGSDTAT